MHITRNYEKVIFAGTREGYEEYVEKHPGQRVHHVSRGFDMNGIRVTAKDLVVLSESFYLLPLETQDDIFAAIREHSERAYDGGLRG